MLDLGPGGLGALYNYLDPATIDAVGLSHLHPDHCLDLCALYVAAAYSPLAPYPPIAVYGPPGAAERIARAYAVPPAAGILPEDTNFERHLRFRDWSAEQQIGPFTVRTAVVPHPTPAYAIRVTETATGASLTYSGDNGPNDAIVALAERTDLLLIESAFLDRSDNPPRPAPQRSPGGRDRYPRRGRVRRDHPHPALARRRAGARRGPPALRRTAQHGGRRAAVDDPARVGGDRYADSVTSRGDGRKPDDLREVRFTRNWLEQAEGSVLVEYGSTRVLVAASVTEGVPRWRKGSGLGWVTSEYAMLPRATNTRSDRESVKGRIGGRTHEISRLIGRSLRAVIDYQALGENTIVLDCDVLQADGGTRTASITGAYVALHDAVSWLRDRHLLAGEPLTDSVAAVSVGVVGDTSMLDLCYAEDSGAEVDMNIVMSGDGRFIEVQGTAEERPFDRAVLDQLLELGAAGCRRLTELQQEALGTR